MIRGICEEVGFIVLNGGLGAVGRIVSGIFWNVIFKDTNVY